MNISEIKELLDQFDHSTLREFSYKQDGEELFFSKNEQNLSSVTTLPTIVPSSEVETVEVPSSEAVQAAVEVVEGDLVESPLVGVAYLSPTPDKPAFVSVGDSVKKGQTLLIVEAMKVMNEIPAPKDGIVTEVLVANEEVVEFGKGLVRIK